MISTIILGALLGATTSTVSNLEVASKSDVEEWKPIKPMSREEFMKLPVEKRREHLFAISYQKYGGVYVKDGTGCGVMRFVNSQKRVSLGELKRPIDAISKIARLRYEIKDGDSVSLENISEVKQRLGGGAVIFIVDEEKYPAILSAPEDGWAIVNVSKLAADNPDHDKLVRRLRKECSRAYAYVAGAANVNQAGSLMGPVASVKDLDGLSGDMLPRETIMKFAAQLKLYGIEPYVQASYRSACENGWAPAPTNAVMKAIWDEVHAAPTNPIMIKPESDKE